MNSLWRKNFWVATAERAIKTFAQTAAALLVGDNVLGLVGVSWVDVGSVAGLAALVSVLTSVGSNAATGDGPSATHSEVVPPVEAGTPVRPVGDDPGMV